MEPKARVDRAEQAQAIVNDTRRRVARSGTSDIRFYSHAYSRKYSRLTHFDAPLTLTAPYSLFSQSPIAKQHSVVLLGRLPPELSSVKKERININREVVDRRSTMGGKTKDHRNGGLCFGVIGQNYNS